MLVFIQPPRLLCPSLGSSLRRLLTVDHTQVMLSAMHKSNLCLHTFVSVRQFYVAPVMLIISSRDPCFRSNAVTICANVESEFMNSD